MVYKQYKIMDEDWCNCLKWDQYVIVVGDMIDCMLIYYVFWMMVLFENKCYVWVKVLKIICDWLEEVLQILVEIVRECLLGNLWLFECCFFYVEF